jgi:hypothetical protein
MINCVREALQIFCLANLRNNTFDASDLFCRIYQGYVTNSM